MTNPPSNGADQIDILIEQVGRLTEGLTEFKVEMQHSMTEFRADLGEIKILIQRQTEAMDKQAEAMDRQVEAMDKQAEAIRQQVNTTDRLVRIVETLMQR